MKNSVALIECANRGKTSHVVNQIFRRRNCDITREARTVGREDHPDSRCRISPELSRGHDHAPTMPQHELTGEIQSADQVFAKGSLNSARF